MVVIKCTLQNCDFKTDDVSEALAIALLTNHGLAHQNTSVSAPTARGPRLERPTVNLGVSIEEWNVFEKRWEIFRNGSGIDEHSAPSQLFQCAGEDLSNSLLRANPQVASSSQGDLIAAMKSLAVIPVATGVSRTELFQLCQERDEPFRTFAARVRGKAETCSFSAKCECLKEVDYTDHMIRDVLLHGIYDSDIRREVLGVTNILEKTVNDVIALVENKEMARNALPSARVSSISSFKKHQGNHQEPDPPRMSEQATCPDCKSLFSIFTKGTRGFNKKNT
jgi:hypothetical protein